MERRFQLFISSVTFLSCVWFHCNWSWGKSTFLDNEHIKANQHTNGGNERKLWRLLFFVSDKAKTNRVFFFFSVKCRHKFLYNCSLITLPLFSIVDILFGLLNCWPIGQSTDSISCTKSSVGCLFCFRPFNTSSETELFTRFFSFHSSDFVDWKKISICKSITVERVQMSNTRSES